MDRDRISRLGTTPPEAERASEQLAPLELGLTVRLDRPFHELKEFLVSEFERAYVTRCLEQSEMNLSIASRTCGLSRKHLRTLISKYGITVTRAVASEGDDHPVTEP
ncbi:MAG: hypothetical protein H0T79_02660 [Deltaproteobacteria bacterium]|nr:hypothetical protein [Deltaproteobacteria bacterium]